MYFRSSDLVDFLHREHFRELGGVSDLWAALRPRGIGHTVLRLRGARADCWWLPTPRDGEQDEDLELPPDVTATF